MERMHTRLSIEECFKRLRFGNGEVILVDNALLKFFRFWDFDKKYYLSIDGNEFKLERIYYRNIYRPIFYGKFTKSDNGTNIEGLIETDWFVKVFDTIWFSFAGLFVALTIFVSIIDLLKNDITYPDSLILLIWPFLIFLFGIFTTKTMKRQAIQWKKELVKFIENTCEAKAIKHNN